MRTSLLAVLAGLLLAGCGEKSGFGFRLPDGDATRGRDASPSGSLKPKPDFSPQPASRRPARTASNDVLIRAPRG